MSLHKEFSFLIRKGALFTSNKRLSLRLNCKIKYLWRFPRCQSSLTVMPCTDESYKRGKWMPIVCFAMAFESNASHVSFVRKQLLQSFLSYMIPHNHLITNHNTLNGVTLMRDYFWTSTHKQEVDCFISFAYPHCRSLMHLHSLKRNTKAWKGKNHQAKVRITKACISTIWKRNTKACKSKNHQALLYVIHRYSSS